MRAEPGDQLRLLDLASIDAEIARLGHRRKNLPELAKIAELMGQRAAVVEEQVAADTRLADAQLELKRIESDIEPAKTRLTRNRERSESGAVSDPKALRSLLEEIEHLSGRISKLEDQQLDAMENVENLTDVRDHIVTRRKSLEDEIRGLMASRDKAFAEIDATASDRGVEREAQRRLVKPELLALYDKIAARSGLGAAELKARRCTGCQLVANDADLRRYAAAAPDEVLRCEECDRILVRTKESGLPE